ncbi:MAG: DUF4010 domain-containing protein [Fimbriimonas sp.]|nr:DUF4010 domain-containing protein [Fimbriimonas sp.]
MRNDLLVTESGWPYLYTLTRLLLALGLGLFIGLERERRSKAAGVRTFAFLAATGCVGGFLGDAYALTALALLVPFIVFLNIHSMRVDDEVEMTTSAALLVVGFIGILCGKGHTFAPVVLGLVTAGLLAWKKPLSGFSVGITEAELRSGILLGILAFVIYPVLPTHPVDPWNLVQPRTVWVTVVLIAAIGFGNYVLLKLFGTKEIGLSGFLAGLVNSMVAVADLSSRVKSNDAIAGPAFRGIMLAAGAMLLRNAVILGILGPACLAVGCIPLGAMFVTCMALSFVPMPSENRSVETSPHIQVESPFSLKRALEFGMVFLVLSVIGTLAQRFIGSAGFYAVCAIGGLVSSSSAVASAGQLASQHVLTTVAGGIGAGIASTSSVTIMIPIVMRMAGDKAFIRRISLAVGLVVIVGIAATLAAYELVPRFFQTSGSFHWA